MVTRPLETGGNTTERAMKGQKEQFEFYYSNVLYSSWYDPPSCELQDE